MANDPLPPPARLNRFTLKIQPMLNSHEPTYLVLSCCTSITSNVSVEY